MESHARAKLALRSWFWTHSTCLASLGVFPKKSTLLLMSVDEILDRSSQTPKTWAPLRGDLLKGTRLNETA